MGTWRDRQNALLKKLIVGKNWLLVFTGIVALLELSVGYANHIQNQSTWKSIASLLRNEVNSANSYQISRSLSDMETENWIKCVRLAETTNDFRIFYDTTTKSYCGFFSDHTEGILQAINGSTWRLSFAMPLNIWYLLVQILIPLLVAIGLHYIYGLIESQKKIQEAERLRVLLEKDILVDLTKQTRHDIASPIGALKLVVQRIDVAPEYAELLKGIVERIDGIFSQLKQANSEMTAEKPAISLAMVSLDKIVSHIVSEKVNEWDLDRTTIETDLESAEVIANEIEMGRVISNLLNNALESKRQDVPVKIKIELVQSHNSMYCLRIIDNGVGMQQEVLEKVGTKGFSFGKSDGNSGVGLWHAYKVIQSFGGTLKIESEPFVGTSISVFLKGTN